RSAQDARGRQGYWKPRQRTGCYGTPPARRRRVGRYTGSGAEVAGRLSALGRVGRLDARRSHARPHDAPRLVGANAGDLGVIASRGDSERGRRSFEKGIPREISAIVHDQEGGVVAG